MSNISAETFLILDAISKLEKGEIQKGDDIEFVERRDDRVVRRFVRDFGGAQKALAIEKYYTPPNAPVVKTEQSVLNWVNENIGDSKIFAWQSKHAVLGKRDNTSVSGQSAAVFEQSFAGIDVYDFIGEVLEHARSAHFPDTPVNHDPGVLLLIWRSVLVALREMHSIGLVHGDAFDENFCLDVHKYWDHTTQSFKNLPGFKAKAIDFGCTMLPTGSRLPYKDMFFRNKRENPLPDDDSHKQLKEAGAALFATYHAAAGGDEHAYQDIGPSIDFWGIANCIAFHNHKIGISQCAKDLGLARAAGSTLGYDVDKAVRLLLDLPNLLANRMTSVKDSSFSGVVHDRHIRAIDTVLNLNETPTLNFRCLKSNSSLQSTKRGLTEKTSISTPEDQAPSGSTSEILLEDKLELKNRRVSPMLLGISGLAIAASAVFFFKPQNFLFNETPAALAHLPAISATKPIAPAIPITPLVTPRLGVIAPNDPAYLVCAGKNALDTAQALIARGPANINETERGVLAAALKSCESLLPRAEPAHSTHLLTMALAAYYALLSEGAERAQDLLTPALLVSDPKLAHETERVLLAQAAISARLGNEEAMYAVLEKAAFVGQALKNLDDDCPLHMPYQSSKRYQKLRAKFNSNTALPVKPLTKSAC